MQISDLRELSESATSRSIRNSVALLWNTFQIGFFFNLSVMSLIKYHQQRKEQNDATSRRQTVNGLRSLNSRRASQLFKLNSLASCTEEKSNPASPDQRRISLVKIEIKIVLIFLSIVKN